MTVDNLIIKLKHFSFVLSSKSVTLQQLSLCFFLRVQSLGDFAKY